MSDLQSVKSLLEAQVSEGRKARRNQEKVLIAVALLLCVSFSTIYYSVSMFSPGMIFDFLFVKGQANIATLNNQLKSSAPAVAELVASKITNIPAQARQSMESKLTPRVDELAVRVQKDLLHHVSTLQLAAADAPQPETIDAYRKQFRRTLNIAHAEILSAVDRFYYQNSDTIREVSGQLRHLAHSRSLSADEKMQRDVIGAWLAIMDSKGTTWAVNW